MSVIGIIAEFNPLHTGHEYLLRKAKAMGKVVCVISGNFVQRGDTALISKEVRAKAALLSGADLVAELPVLWSMSTAQNFALGGVSALLALGCDTLLFGSEKGEIEPLLEIADILETREFSTKLNEFLGEGITFAKARQRAVEALGGEKGILEHPNNNLGIEYILASRKLGAKLDFKTVKRKGALHDSTKIDKFVSATLLREKLLGGDFDFAKKYIPKSTIYLYKRENFSNIQNIEKGILSVLRLKARDDLLNLPDLSEGVENKLYAAIRVATSLDKLYNDVKVKRYPLARIRRLVLSAVLGFDNEFFMKPLPYVRVLGFNDKGKEILKNANSKIPVVTRVSEIKNTKVFETECRATDLFNLSLKVPRKCGEEYTFKLITEE